MDSAPGIQYGRKWAIYIYRKGEKDNENTRMDVSLLRCVFRCTYSIKSPATSLATLVVYNMNATTEKEVIENGFQFSIYGGYEQGQYGEIYTGDIIQVIRNRENGIDYRLEMIAIRGSAFFDVNHVRAAVAAGSTPRQNVQTIAGQADEPISPGETSDKIPDTPLPRGKVFFGTPCKYLRDICQWNNAWFELTMDEKLDVHQVSDEVPQEKCIELTPNTGLVGAPRYTDNGIVIKMLLDPRVHLGTLIKIDNELIQKQLIAIGQDGSSQGQPQQSVFDANGEYQAASVTHSGDTYGDEWTTEVVSTTRNGANGLYTQQQDAKQSVV